MQEAYFPLFVNLSGKKGILFGGGTIAARRGCVLLEFGVQLTVVAPEISPKLAQRGAQLLRRPYCPGDCRGYDLVLAATNDRQVNHAIYLEAKRQNCLVNVCDAKEECDFYFPALIREEPFTIGITSAGKDPRLVRQLAAQIRYWVQNWKKQGGL